MSFTTLLLGWSALALATFVVLLRVPAPYGRYASERWGPSVPHRAGWVAMELVSPAAFLFFFLAGSEVKTAVPWLFAALWSGHYLNRAVFQPLRSPASDRRMPVVIMGAAMLFNAVNGFLNGHYLGDLAGPYPTSWLSDPRFLIGAMLFVAGAGLNAHGDRVLRRLRGPGETGYAIPVGGMYRWVSCPNYLGEIVEWIGFALLTWSPAALAFALWTAANLVPRALAHHRWYRDRFPEYPRERKALVPGLL